MRHKVLLVGKGLILLIFKTINIYLKILNDILCFGFYFECLTDINSFHFNVS
jgi:hypothetical protein